MNTRAGDSVVWTATCFNSGGEISFSGHPSRPTMESSLPYVKWVPELFPRGFGRDLAWTTHLHLVPRLRMTNATPLLYPCACVTHYGKTVMYKYMESLEETSPVMMKSLTFFGKPELQCLFPNTSPLAPHLCHPHVTMSKHRD